MDLSDFLEDTEIPMEYSITVADGLTVKDGDDYVYCQLCEQFITVRGDSNHCMYCMDNVSMILTPDIPNDTQEDRNEMERQERCRLRAKSYLLIEKIHVIMTPINKDTFQFGVPSADVKLQCMVSTIQRSLREMDGKVPLNEETIKKLEMYLAYAIVRASIK